MRFYDHTHPKNLDTLNTPAISRQNSSPLPKIVTFALDLMFAGFFLWPWILSEKMGVDPDILTNVFAKDMLLMPIEDYAMFGIAWVLAISVCIPALLGKTLSAWLDKKAFLLVPLLFILPPILG